MFIYILTICRIETEMLSSSTKSLLVFLAAAKESSTSIRLLFLTDDGMQHRLTAVVGAEKMFLYFWRSVSLLSLLALSDLIQRNFVKPLDSL